ncbi:MAG: ABC transporter ATP-binding protein [Lachnospiraceae bacterium]|nr:ABC transporter ATP-binding protein [Lachnospiraceae bacterium]
MTALLECNNLTKRYTSSKTALNHINISLPAGRIIGLLGPNGSGKTTFLKLAAGLLSPTEGEILIHGQKPGPATKAMVSYLPDRTYFDSFRKVKHLLDFFETFYADFNKEKALHLLNDLSIRPDDRLKSMSKGTKEKMELILTMSREASVYLLDEPIGGVDPAARDYILNTILTNYNENATILISTHLIQDIESVLDDVIFIKNGELVLYDSSENIRIKEQKSVDQLFREVFRC